MRPYVEEIAAVADTLVSAHPNAGLPNELGGYDETPEQMAAILGEFAAAGLLNVVGGCCGTGARPHPRHRRGGGRQGAAPGARAAARARSWRASSPW